MIRGDGAEEKNEMRAPFVEKVTYRRRRLMDIARIAPVIGAVLFAVPLLWNVSGRNSEVGAQDGVVMTSTALVYIFSVWSALILFALGFSIAVRLWAVHWTKRADAEALRGPVGQTTGLPHKAAHVPHEGASGPRPEAAREDNKDTPET